MLCFVFGRMFMYLQRKRICKGSAYILLQHCQISGTIIQGMAVGICDIKLSPLNVLMVTFSCLTFILETFQFCVIRTNWLWRPVPKVGGWCVVYEPLDRYAGRHLDRYVGRHLDQCSTDMLVDISTDSRRMCKSWCVGRPTYRPISWLICRSLCWPSHLDRHIRRVSVCLLYTSPSPRDA